MQLTDILGRMGGLQSMARDLGVTEAQAASGAAVLLPAILGGLKKQTQSQPAGLAGLGGLLGPLGGGDLLDNVLSTEATDVDRGNGVLGQIFGSRDVSRKVAQHAAARSGLDPGLLKKMLPILAMMAAGYLAKQHAAGDRAQDAPPTGGFGNLLGTLFGGQRDDIAIGPGAIGGGLASILDMDGDGNPLDDILRTAGKVLR